MAGEKLSLRDRTRNWFRSNWKLVAAVSLSLLAAIIVAALCTTPVGAPIVAAFAAVKLFAFVATVGPVALPFVMAGLTMAAGFITFGLWNAAVWVNNWLDNKANPKKGGTCPSDSEDNIPEVSSGFCGLGGKSGKGHHHAAEQHRRQRDELNFRSSGHSAEHDQTDPHFNASSSSNGL